MHDVFEGADGSCHVPRYRRHRILLLPHEILDKMGFWRGHWLIFEGLHVTIGTFCFVSQGAARWTTHPEGADGIYLGPQGFAWSGCILYFLTVQAVSPPRNVGRASKTSS